MECYRVQMCFILIVSREINFYLNFLLLFCQISFLFFTLTWIKYHLFFSHFSAFQKKKIHSRRMKKKHVPLCIIIIIIWKNLLYSHCIHMFFFAYLFSFAGIYGDQNEHYKIAGSKLTRKIRINAEPAALTEIHKNLTII